ncbi:MAG: hypothetical protein FJ398_14350 [Verrucomicrobia bacterium]|nr:hypothetical protein [Verrucomicrobiota bacterium]
MKPVDGRAELLLRRVDRRPAARQRSPTIRFMGSCNGEGATHTSHEPTPSRPRRGVRPTSNIEPWTMGSFLFLSDLHLAHEPGRASPSRRAARRAWNTSDSAR